MISKRQNKPPKVLKLSLSGVTTELINYQETITESTQAAELLFALKCTLAKLAVNVGLFTPILEAQCLNAHNAIKNLIETSMQPEIFY